LIAPDFNRVYSAVQLAVPMIRGPAENETVITPHFDVSKVSSNDVFMPTRRIIGEVKGGGSNPLELKVRSF
jgi:hypothetical protein